MGIQINNSKSFILNADDFGYSREVNDGIMLLVERGIVNSISVMVNGPELSIKDIERLKKLKGQGIFVGIHLNLTEFSPVTLQEINGCFGGLKTLVESIVKNNLDEKKIIFELQSQLTLFSQLFEFKPGHIDSHHHIHQLPRIDNYFLRVFLNGSWHETLIRNTAIDFKLIMGLPLVLTSKSFFKTAFLSILGKRLKRKLTRNHFLTNQNLFGIYSFGEKSGYDKIFSYYFRFLKHDIIYITHPAFFKSHCKLSENWRYEEFLFFKKF